ncbi:hypothetical protein DFH08DRAFT_955626 [Mycena albidolilacea]|uniref:Uncharacterized protein n=1 Tax=Mycena albidolilacea TaxID=1033008 RepID=A0AAD7ABH5_9AGAR|nr:hypothetical protein DFH08DRAFT_955626 [Mycena albidolilacea]
MTGFALAGALLAVVHHIYFVSLHLTPADGTVRVGGQPVSHQKIANFIATVFIFLVKLCLSLSKGSWRGQLLHSNTQYHGYNRPNRQPRKGPNGRSHLYFSPIRSYNTAGPIPQSVANKALIDQDIATWTSPCGAGADCSYNLTFFAPSFKCSAPTSTAVQAIVPIWNVQALIKGTDTDTLSVQYFSDLEGNIISQTNCTSFNSTYSLAVAYHDNQQKINILNITLGIASAIFPSEKMNQLNAASDRLALAAVKDAVSNDLLGSVFQDRETGLNVSGITLYSALANNTIPTNPSFRTDTPQLIEQLLANTTISLIARALWRRLLCGRSVGVTLLCMAVGLHALGRNGGGGGKAFSLIMATTLIPALDAVTNRALHEKDYRETYSNLRFRYTNLDGRNGNRLAFQES